MASVKIEGLDKLQKALKENVKLDDVKRVVRTNGLQLQKGMERDADFKKGYATGATKGSIRLSFEDSGFTAVVGPGTEYSPYLEYGTRFMTAQPFIFPAYETQKKKFKKDMSKLVR